MMNYSERKEVEIIKEKVRIRLEIDFFLYYEIKAKYTFFDKELLRCSLNIDAKKAHFML
jgi:hypothetical protein